VTILQQLLDAERAGRDAGWIESFTSHYQRLCEQARAAGFVRLKWATAKVERANRAGAGDKGGQFNDEPPF
jgi:hypothetical protein